MAGTTIGVILIAFVGICLRRDSAASGSMTDLLDTSRHRHGAAGLSDLLMADGSSGAVRGSSPTGYDPGAQRAQSWSESRNDPCRGQHRFCRSTCNSGLIRQLPLSTHHGPPLAFGRRMAESLGNHLIRHHLVYDMSSRILAEDQIGGDPAIARPSRNDRSEDRRRRCGWSLRIRLTADQDETRLYHLPCSIKFDRVVRRARDR